MSSLDKINHFVVLMLENRSFDNLLGLLHTNPPVNGITGQETNPDSHNHPVKVWSTDANRVTWMPDPDPGERFPDINQQLFGTTSPAAGATPDMSGFVRDYTSADVGGAAQTIMHCFRPDQIPALSTLATSFAVSDAWFAAAPCQTWPNRFFVHTGTANGYENNAPPRFPYLMQTIFNELDDVVPHGWKIYFHDFPQSLTLAKLWPHLDHFRPIDEFFSDAQHGQLPSYSFLEPRYFADLDWPNDMHPPHNVAYGDQLVAKVYDALRHSPCWNSTLFVVIFDEHGGCYDHVAPPPAPMPEAPRPDQVFAFDRYGVRVPAVVISPYIKPGTVFQSPAPQPFDHTSVISTLRARFGIKRPLTGRDANAPTLECVLTLEQPDNHGPAAPIAPALSPTDDDAAALSKARSAPLNGFQAALRDASAYLAPLIHGVAIDTHIQNLSSGFTPTAKPGNSATEVLPALRNLLQRLLP